MAEVAECIALDSYCDPLKKEYLSNELADVFAWVNSLCNTLNYYYNTDDFNLQTIISETILISVISAMSSDVFVPKVISL